MRRLWFLYAGLAGCALVAQAVLPDGPIRTGLVLAVALSAVLAVVAGTWLHRPPYELPWVVLATALATSFAADVLAARSDPASSGPVTGPSVQGPGWSDLVHLAAYAVLAASLLLTHRRRSTRGEWAGLVDAAVIATTAALGYWVFVVDLLADEGTGAQVVAGLYLVADVVLLALVARLVVAGLRQPAFSLLAAGVAALLVTDVAALTQSYVTRDEAGALPQAGWLLGAVLWAAAALHPSMRELTDSYVPRDAPGVATVRLALLGAVVMIPPTMIGLQAARGDYSDLGLLIVGLLVLVVLVLVRVGLLMRSVGSTAERERALRAAAAEFVAGGDRGQIRAAALKATHLLLGRSEVASRIVDTSDSDDFGVAASARGRHARVLGRTLVERLLPYAGDHRSPDGARVEELAQETRVALDLAETSGHLTVRPARVQDETLALLVVVTDGPPSPEVVDALDTLVAQLALALESATLSAELYLRQGEARFRALVQNSSDAILLVDRGATVTYQSPSAERVLGFAAGELVGTSLDDLSHHDDLMRFQACLTEVLARPGLSRRIELRMMRGEGAYIDGEAVVHNLQSDPHVGATLVTVRDISERKKFEMALTQQAFHDELTGLANRTLFVDRVAHALRRRERDRTSVAVLLLDLDDFKTVNDGLGHAAGDSLLRAVASRLEGLVRPGDTTARLGGDEFAMVLVDLPAEENAIIAVERIIATLSEPLVLEGREVFAQASIGVAFAGPGDVEPEDLLRNADAAMYVVKTDGKGRYAIFEPHMHAAAVHRLDLRTDLQRALDNEEFVLHYQPIVSMTTGALTGLEALVRWQHPHRGLVHPDEFIPLAEETGLVVPLGLWVLDRACRQIAEWGKVDPALTVSINVSQRQLRRIEFGKEVGRVLDASGVDPARVNLEITESAVMTDVEATIRRLRDLKDLGVRLAVDDFGTGYSSFSWLRQLPVDVLKIDKEFVEELGNHEQSGFLVATIIDLAHNMGLSTVAEGIERGVQLDRLRDMHCDLGQGYHLGRPMPVDSVVDLLAIERTRTAEGA